MSMNKVGKLGYNSGVFSVFLNCLSNKKSAQDVQTLDAYDEDERDLDELKQADLNNHKYDNARNFIETLYEGTGITFEYFMRDPNGVVQRSIPNKMPDIKAVVTDWDGTVGDLYEKQADAVWEFIMHICKTRGITSDFLQDYLKEGGKTEKHFTSYDFFSIEGLERILKSEPFSVKNPQTETFYSKDFSAEDKDFVEGKLKSLMDAAYSHVYKDAIKLFKDLQARKVPVFVHTDSPFSELIDKLIAVSECTDIPNADKPIKFRTENGNIIGLENSVFVGLSVQVSESDWKRIKNDEKRMSVIAALQKEGISIIENTGDERKPAPGPLAKIQSSLLANYGEIKPSEMLMMGDILSKDGAFALQNDMYYAWPGHKAKLTRKAVAINRITAAGNTKHKNRILGQIRPFADNYLGNNPDNMKKICNTMAVCRSYTELKTIFNFKEWTLVNAKSTERLPVSAQNKFNSNRKMVVVEPKKPLSLSNLVVLLRRKQREL